MPKAPAKPAPVPEHVLKKRKAQESIAAAKAAKMVEDKKASKIERKAIYDKAAKYMKEYKAMEKDVVEKRREAKKTGNFYMEPEPKLMLVVRIKGINAVAPKTRKILQLMRLRQVCCANTCLAPARPLARASLVLHPQRSREREVENALAICVTAGRSSLVAGYGIETQDGMSVLPWKCEEQRRVICSRSRGSSVFAGGECYQRSTCGPWSCMELLGGPGRPSGAEQVRQASARMVCARSGGVDDVGRWSAVLAT